MVQGFNFVFDDDMYAKLNELADEFYDEFKEAREAEDNKHACNICFGKWLGVAEAIKLIMKEHNRRVVNEVSNG